MSLLVVGSVALDSVETPFGKAENVLGGSATFFSASASHFAPVQVVGIVGKDYPLEQLRASFAKRPVDLSGVELADGSSFRWRGRYRHDLNVAETLETHLGVFSNFRPKIPDAFRNASFVFLGNIDPRLQLEVLTQVARPTLVACDTMNFWIESRRSDLLALLERVDLITLNDGEARQVTDCFNLVKAARWIMARGPKMVIIKKGEHGAFMFTGSSIFFAPAYPLEEVFDPTGAGDSFAGGFMGYLARTGDLSDANLRRAVVHGSAMGSFAVEQFSVNRLLEIESADIAKRVAEFRRLVAFEEGRRVTKGLDYRAAGVDIDAADDAKHRIKRIVESTFTAGALGGFGGFGGMFRMPADLTKPVLVSSADGVGTKIKVGIEANRHDTIGHDLVNHCVNDILVQGAAPLFFLDYVAFGRLDPPVVESLVAGVAAGCRENGCALLGGETAEMPGVYTPPDYDLAGFIVGYVDEDAVLGPHRVAEGDVLIGLASNGLHTNGYSLARRIVSERMHRGAHDAFPGEDATVAEVLLRVHRSYSAVLRPLLPSVHAMAHITGGGLPGNLNRALPVGLDAIVETGTWDVPNVFVQLERAGAVARPEMFRAFNMGIGMVVIVAEADAVGMVRRITDFGIPAWQLGRVVRGDGTVIFQ